MAKTAQQVAEKYASRAANAAPEYLSGAESTTKDQSTAAIAAKTRWQAELTAAFGRGSYEKGLGKSGKAGWLAGIRSKGAERFGPGAAAATAKYATNSARFDSARNAASGMPIGPRGSETNFARAKAVGMALRAAKVGGA